jgi:hypothetical protein
MTKQFKPLPRNTITSMPPKYLIVHCMHAGCYDYKTEKEDKKISLMSRVKINPPKVFMFDDKYQANEFFHEYMNGIDCVDVRCKKGNETEHIDRCTCGIIDMDEEGDPILFYNKVHQIFLLEMGGQTFIPSKNLRIDINNMNLTNNHIKGCRILSNEQRDVYIQLGQACQDCNNDDDDDDDDDDK